MRVKLLIIAQVLISVLSCGNSMNNNIKENKNESKNTIYKNEVKEKMKIVMKVNGKIYNVELLNTSVSGELRYFAISFCSPIILPPKPITFPSGENIGNITRFLKTS